MSVQEMSAGLNDLENAVVSARKTKQANQQLAQQRAANQQFAQTIADSPQGNSLPGKLAAQGVASGQLDLDKANQMLSVFGDPTKAIMMLSADAMGTTDPVERQNKLHVINQFMIPYNNVKGNQAFTDAYNRANGQLTAESQFGVLNKGGRGGGGGGGGGGTNNPNNQQTYTTGPSQVGTTPITTDWSGMAGDLKKFITEDELSGGWKEPDKGFFKQQMEPEELSAFQSRLAHRANDYLMKNDPVLGKPGMEGPRADAVTKFITNVGKGGTLGTFSTSNVGGVEQLVPFTTTVNAPTERVLNSVQGSVTVQKSKKKSATTNFLGAPAPANAGQKSLDDVLSGKL